MLKMPLNLNHPSILTIHPYGFCGIYVCTPYFVYFSEVKYLINYIQTIFIGKVFVFMSGFYKD